MRFVWLFSVGLSFLFLSACDEGTAGQSVVVYKSPTCGCCEDWITHMSDAGFSVTAIDSNDMMSVKEKHGVSGKNASCHTAIVDGYIIEGHVPASDVKRLLKEKPAIAGLTAPGMQDKGLPPKGYDVLAFDKQGNSTVFQRYE